MNTETCFLTTKDFTILEVMRDRRVGDHDALAPILKSKIDHALVVFREDIPVNVATLSSRVTFSVNGREPDTRVISHDHMTLPVGMYLPITTARGLALLGLVEGQTFVLTNGDGLEERVVLEQVEYQPEAAKREKDAMKSHAPSSPYKPSLRLIPGAGVSWPQLVSDGYDDPGPAAA
jgi:regulator of nucleoside diphosphate kinase